MLTSTARRPCDGDDVDGTREGGDSAGWPRFWLAFVPAAACACALVAVGIYVLDVIVWMLTVAATTAGLIVAGVLLGLSPRTRSVGLGLLAALIPLLFVLGYTSESIGNSFE
jgi:hypothetical protein